MAQGRIQKFVFEVGKTASNVKEKFLSLLFGEKNTKKFRSLSSSQQNSFISIAIRSILDKSADKMSEIDTRDIDSSRGSLKKIKNYSHFKKALEKIKKICDDNRKHSDEVKSLFELEQNLLRYEKFFVEAYTKNSKRGKLLYQSCCLNWSYGICLCIGRLIDYDSMINSDTDTHWRIRENPRFKDSFVFKSVKKLNSDFSNRQNIEKYFGADEVFQESVIGSILLGAVATVAGIALTVYTLRCIVEKFYQLKKAIKREARIVAEFLEANAGTLDNKNIRERQRALAKRLKMLADSLEEKDEITDDRTQEALNREEESNVKELDRELENTASDDYDERAVDNNLI